MKALRRRIDECDRTLLKILATRFRAARKVGLYKLSHDLPVLQKSRWAEIMEARLKLAKRLSLDEDFTTAIFGLIHKESLKIQKEEQRAKKGKKTRS
ncbi:chorismate mutase [Bdellovibrionota bacterium FG-2]